MHETTITRKANTHVNKSKFDIFDQTSFQKG